jgi:hypothetical protein
LNKKLKLTGLLTGVVALTGLAIHPVSALSPKVKNSTTQSVAQPLLPVFAELDSEIWWSQTKGSLSPKRDMIKRTTVYCDGTIRESTFWFPDTPAQHNWYFAPSNTPAGRPMDSQIDLHPFSDKKAVGAGTVTRSAWPSVTGFTTYKKTTLDQRYKNIFTPSPYAAGTPNPPQLGNAQNIWGQVTLLTPVKTRNLCQVKLTKTFTPASIPSGGSSVLEFALTPVVTITNPPAGTGNVNDPWKFVQPTAFADNLTKGLIATGVLTSSCGGSPYLASTGEVVKFGGTMLGTDPSTPCKMSVTVTANGCGKYPNDQTNLSGLSPNIDAANMNAVLDVTGSCSTAGGSGGTGGSGGGGSTTTSPPTSTTSTTTTTSSTTSTTIAANGPGPSLNKFFSPASVSQSQGTTLTFELKNPAGSPARTGLSFVDTLATNLLASVLNSTNSCGGQLTISATSVALSGVSLAAGPSQCTVTVKIPDALPCGSYFNTPKTVAGSGNVLATGLDMTGMSASLVVNCGTTTTTAASSTTTTLPTGNGPKLIKYFNPAASPTAGGVVTLNFVIDNPAGSPAQSGISITDVLSANLLTIAPVVVNQCGATVTVGSTVLITNASIGAGPSQCLIRLTLSPAALPCGTYTNSAKNVAGLGNLTATGIDISATSATLKVC